MYRVLVPVDDAVDRATRQATYLTEVPWDADDIQVFLGHTLDKSDREAPESMQRADRVETVRKARGILEAADIETEAIDLDSPPRDGILHAVDDHDVDEIVMSGRRRSPAEKAILGSVTQSVILNADVPVTVVND
ncbi:MAG: universal stress protein [Halanaeroarchaeum sp.]